MSRARRKKANLEFYNFSEVLSQNAVYNFIIGGRGLGKTYGAKKHVIKKFLRHGEQFIYLRRYKTEMGAKSSFFADIMEEFPGEVFRVEGHLAQILDKERSTDDDQKWLTMGYFIALSNAQSKKSIAYPDVTTIIFDEFIIEKGAIHYLPDESKVFNDFYSTVDRWKDKTRVLFLANALTIMNPYFLAFKIEPDGRGLVKYFDGFVCVHYPDSEAFKAGVFKTRFGQFIQGTEYADYSVGNMFHDNHGNLIEVKTEEAKYFLTLETTSGIFSIWVDSYVDTTYYVQRKRPKEEGIFTTILKNVSDDVMFLPYSHKILANLRAAYSTGRVLFDSPQSREGFAGIWERTR